MKLEDIKNAAVVWGAVSQEGIKCLRETGGAVVIPEIRPSLLGLYHNAKMLDEEGIRFVCCCDSVLGLLFFKGKIDKTLLFCKKIEGQRVVARAGSLYAALLSKAHGVDIVTMEEGEFDFEKKDKDAASLGGRKMILENDCGGYVISGDDERFSLSKLLGKSH